MWHAASQLIIQCFTIKTIPIKYATHSISLLTVKSAHPGDNISSPAAGLAFPRVFVLSQLPPHPPPPPPNPTSCFPHFAFTLLLTPYTGKAFDMTIHYFWNVRISITNLSFYILNLLVSLSTALCVLYCFWWREHQIRWPNWWEKINNFSSVDFVNCRVHHVHFVVTVGVSIISFMINCSSCI